MKNYAIILILIIFCSCKNSEEKSDLTSIDTIAAKNCDCVASAKDELAFFTVEFLSEFAKPAVPVVEIHKTKNYIIYNSQWENDGLVHFFNIEEIETLSDLKEKRKFIFKNNPDLTMVDYVKQTYKSMTQKEVEQYEALLNEQTEKNKDGMSEADKNVKDKLQGTMLDMQKNAYTNIENLGDHAVYNKKSNDLFVVCGDILFHVRGQVGPWGKHDLKKGLELAKTVTKKIIDQCQ